MNGLAGCHDRNHPCRQRSARPRAFGLQKFRLLWRRTPLSGHGPSRLIALPHELGRYRGKADVATSHYALGFMGTRPNLAGFAQRPWILLEPHLVFQNPQPCCRPSRQRPAISAACRDPTRFRTGPLNFDISERLWGICAAGALVRALSHQRQCPRALLFRHQVEAAALRVVAFPQQSVRKGACQSFHEASKDRPEASPRSLAFP